MKPENEKPEAGKPAPEDATPTPSPEKQEPEGDLTAEELEQIAGGIRVAKNFRSPYQDLEEGGN